MSLPRLNVRVAKLLKHAQLKKIFVLKYAPNAIHSSPVSRSLSILEDVLTDLRSVLMLSKNNHIYAS